MPTLPLRVDAEVTAIIVVLAGIVAAVAWRRLVRYPREVGMPRSLRSAVLVTAVAAAGGTGYTALLGGRIVHDAPGRAGPAPMRQAAPAAPSPSVASPAADTARRADSAATATPRY